jgi:hypothetical protein
MDAAVRKKIDSLFGDSLKHLHPMSISRRSFLKSTGALTLMASGCVHIPPRPKRILVNDVQSRLNPTYVEKVISVESLPQLQRLIQAAARRGAAVSLCGGRHAMGAQQFLTNGILLDTTKLVRVLNFDADDGTIEVQAGIQWPALLKFLLRKQSEPNRMWTFAQKQTGANRFCIGGALGSNIHNEAAHLKHRIIHFAGCGRSGSSLQPEGKWRVVHVGDRRIRIIWRRPFCQAATRSAPQDAAGRGFSQCGRSYARFRAPD